MPTLVHQCHISLVVANESMSACGAMCPVMKLPSPLPSPLLSPIHQPSQPLRENLVTVGFYSDKDPALQLVPADVLLQHYMHFVVLLRK